MSPSRDDAAQRPWPPPQRPWVMAQRWHDLLFAHWPVPAKNLEPLLPGGLPLDTYEGQAWVGVVPFRMSGVRLRGLFPVPTTSAFPELNVRTYVTLDDRPGVWFFSLDAGSRLAVEAARLTFHLPYFRAQMRAERQGEVVHYESRRTDRRGLPALLLARYRPTSPVYHSTAGTLEHWLTARYALYAADARGHLYRGEIDHAPWPLQTAEAEIEANTMGVAAGFSLPGSAPLLHFAAYQEVRAWYLQRVR